jgi:hypothetical protein
MPLVTLLAVAAVVLAWRRRASLYAPVADRPAWSVALLAGLAGSTAGALTNDSGPVLLVIGVFVLAWATAYVQGAPHPAEAVDAPVRPPAGAPRAGSVAGGD